MDAHDPYAALRFPGYRLLLCGGVIASIGAEIQAAAVGWELYKRTGDPSTLGYTGLAQFLPVLLLALPAGQAADRYSRTRLFQGAQFTAALASLGLAFLSLVQGPIALVYLFLVFTGIARAVSTPARQSLLAQVIPLEALTNAVTWNSSGWQIANVAGPALAGGLIWLTDWYPDYHAAPVYLYSVACSLTCVVLIGFIQPSVTVRPRVPRTFASLVEGIRFVWRTEPLLAAITLDLFAVLLGGATALLPIYATDILKVGALGFGCLRAAPALGAVVMALLLAHRRPMRRPGRALLASVAGFGLATIVFGLSENFALSLVMLMALGALDNVSVVVRGTLMQTLTPDEMRGRVSAVNIVFISSSNELGAFESGVTAKLGGEAYTRIQYQQTTAELSETAKIFGATASVVGGGVGTVLVVLLVMWRWPRLWHLGELHKQS